MTNAPGSVRVLGPAGQDGHVQGDDPHSHLNRFEDHPRPDRPPPRPLPTAVLSCGVDVNDAGGSRSTSPWRNRSCGRECQVRPWIFRGRRPEPPQRSGGRSPVGRADGKPRRRPRRWCRSGHELALAPKYATISSAATAVVGLPRDRVGTPALQQVVPRRASTTSGCLCPSRVTA